MHPGLRLHDAERRIPRPSTRHQAPQAGQEERRRGCPDTLPAPQYHSQRAEDGVRHEGGVQYIVHEVIRDF